MKRGRPLVVVVAIVSVVLRDWRFAAYSASCMIGAGAS